MMHSLIFINIVREVDDLVIVLCNSGDTIMPLSIRDRPTAQYLQLRFTDMDPVALLDHARFQMSPIKAHVPNEDRPDENEVLVIPFNFWAHGVKCCT
jgi:hypothetical protein